MRQVTSGELRLKIAGDRAPIELQAGEAAVLSAHLWVHVLTASGHSLALVYGAEPHKAALSRAGGGARASCCRARLLRAASSAMLRLRAPQGCAAQIRPQSSWRCGAAWVTAPRVEVHTRSA